MKKDNLVENLHVCYQEDPLINNILNAAGIELNNLDETIKDIEKQYWFDTITWGIPILEKILELKTDANSSLEDRRNLLGAKWKADGKTDYEMIKSIIASFTKSHVTVYFDGRINIQASNETGTSLNLKSIFDAIEEIKPAHLNFNFGIKHDENLKAKVDCKTYYYSLPVASLTTYVGTLPEPVTLARSYSTNIKANSDSTKVDCYYNIPLCGTVPYIANEARIYSCSMVAKGNLNKNIYSYDIPLCGTVPYQHIDVLYREEILNFKDDLINAFNSYKYTSNETLIEALALIELINIKANNNEQIQEKQYNCTSSTTYVGGGNIV